MPSDRCSIYLSTRASTAIARALHPNKDLTVNTAHYSYQSEYPDLQKHVTFEMIATLIDEPMLLKTRNCGKGTVEEIAQNLKIRGFQLAGHKKTKSPCACPWCHMPITIGRRQ